MQHAESKDSQHGRQLEAIAALRITSRDPNEALNEIAEAAAQIFEVPSAFITVGSADSGWHQGRFGLPPGFAVSEDGPDEFVMGAAIGSKPVVVSDLMADPASSGTGLVSAVGARFYAGVPLITPDGEALGTLCILDKAPRRFSHEDVLLLRALATRALDETGLRVDRVRAQQERETAEARNRENAEMVAWTAHELKNPLTVIKGISTMLVADPKFPLEMRMEFLNTITKQVDRMIRIIDETLDLARLETGLSIHLDIQSVDLADRLAAVAAFYDAASPRHRVVLELHDASHDASLDRDKIDQVFYNLVGNAVKYSPEGGPVTIRSRVSEDFVEVTVADQGLGMTPEQVEKLFGRFNRMHSDSSPKIKGTGLGLYLSKHLVEIHGGQIWAESTPGGGSTFYVRLPVGLNSD